MRLPSRIVLAMLAAALALVLDPGQTLTTGVPACTAAWAKRHHHRKHKKHRPRHRRKRHHKAAPATEM